MDKEFSEREERYAQLADKYEAWMRRERLDLGSADEHLHDQDLTQEQRAWLYRFVQRWDAV